MYAGSFRMNHQTSGCIIILLFGIDVKRFTEPKPSPPQIQVSLFCRKQALLFIPFIDTHLQLLQPPSSPLVPPLHQPEAAPTSSYTSPCLHRPFHLVIHLQNHPLRTVLLPIQLLILVFHNRERLHNRVHIVALDTIQVKISRIKLAAQGDFYQDKK